jgi:hypothetical protein
MKKWYLASRTKHRNKVKSIIKMLRFLGDDVSYDWTQLQDLYPIFKHKELCNKIAGKISHAISKTDVFVLISDQAGTDMYVELGIAISSASRTKKPVIYAIGKQNKRSLMQNHPLIIHKETFDEILDEQNHINFINHTNKKSV